MMMRGNGIVAFSSRNSFSEQQHGRRIPKRQTLLPLRSHDIRSFACRRLVEVLEPVLSQAVASGAQILHQQPVQQPCGVVGAENQASPEFPVQHPARVCDAHRLEVVSEEQETRLKLPWLAKEEHQTPAIRLSGYHLLKTDCLLNESCSTHLGTALFSVASR